jgi:hypothetical protein
MRTKYWELKTVFYSMVLWNDVRRSYMWWIMIHVGERWYSLHNELIKIYVILNWEAISTQHNCICILILSNLKMATRVAETFWWLLCNKITCINPSAFIGLFNKFYSWTSQKLFIFERNCNMIRSPDLVRICWGYLKKLLMLCWTFNEVDDFWFSAYVTTPKWIYFYKIK